MSSRIEKSHQRLDGVDNGRVIPTSSLKHWLPQSHVHKPLLKWGKGGGGKKKKWEEEKEEWKEENKECEEEEEKREEEERVEEEK